MDPELYPVLSTKKLVALVTYQDVRARQHVLPSMIGASPRSHHTRK